MVTGIKYYLNDKGLHDFEKRMIIRGGPLEKLGGGQKQK